MNLIDHRLLAELTAKAQSSPRLRMNHNFHLSLESKSQRMLNALEPGTQLDIHRHPHTAETYIVLKGSIRVSFYDDQKNLSEQIVLDPAQEVYGLDIPAGQFHTLEVLEPKTVIFEAKDGPYTPLGTQDIL